MENKVNESMIAISEEQARRPDLHVPFINVNWINLKKGENK